MYEFTSFIAAVYGVYTANYMDLLGDMLKNCTPNLKKKKDAAIDKFKGEIIKPLKDLID